MLRVCHILLCTFSFWLSGTAFVTALFAGTNEDTVTAQSPNGVNLVSTSALPIDEFGNAPGWAAVVQFTPCSMCLTTLDVQVQYTAPNGKRSIGFAQGFLDGNGVYEFMIPGEGGTAILSWKTTNRNKVIGSGTVNFKILGRQPSPQTIDSIFATPWFWSNAINQESGYRQFNLRGDTDVYGVQVGYPLIGGDGFGTGLTQIDPRSHSLSDGDLWTYSRNLIDGAGILNAAQSGAYSFWNSQVSQMQNENPGTNPPATNFAFCQFAYPQGSVHGYQDAEWINAYNGTGGNNIYPAGYFIFWQNAVNGNPGSWVIRSNVRTYVSDVCSTPAR